MRRHDVAGRLRLIVCGLSALVAALGGCTARPGDRPAAAPSRSSTTLGSPLTTRRPEPVEPRSAVAVALDKVWQATPAGCALVVSGDRVVYAANPDLPVVPASVTKLLTATAALDVLGASARITTSVRGRMDTNGLVEGDLWIVGGGDPVLGTNAWAARSGGNGRLHTSLDVLADRAVAAGLRRIQGRVVGDETRYDAQRTVRSWPQRLVADGEVGPLSALVANDGFRVWGHPGVPFADPAVGTAGLFLELLRQRGVEVAGVSTSGKASGDADIASIASPAVGELVEELLRESDNGTAELLVKEMGLRRYGEGSTTAGVKAIVDTLGARRLSLAGTVVADGSGLSADARVTCRLLATLLTSAEPLLAPRLAVASRSGTLRTRLRGSAAEARVQAKTGSLDGIAGVAGYARTAGGESFSFAYVANGLPNSARAGRTQDSFLLALFV